MCRIYRCREKVGFTFCGVSVSRIISCYVAMGNMIYIVPPAVWAGDEFRWDLLDMVVKAISMALSSRTVRSDMQIW